MKFQTENKKPTLCIYTDADYSTEKLEWEVRSLRQELDGTRAALRLQAARCRHLVAAFSTQISRSEQAARSERELRDEQLSRMLRALLVLDAGLRREQRNIRDQLRSKDSVIHAQRIEIAILKGDKDLTREEAEDISRTYLLQEDMFGEITRVRLYSETTKNGDMINESNKSNSQLKTFKSHPHVKLNKNVNKTKALTNNKIVKSLSSSGDEHQEGLEELQRMAKGLKKEIVEMSIDESYTDQEEEGMNRNLYEDYQHNPVLECVNQILLRDFEDDDDDKENYQRWPAVRTVREITETHLNGDDTKKKMHPKDQAASPPIKAQLLEEKACLLMTSQRLTLVRHADIDNVDNDKNAENIVEKNDAPKQDSPPALPPKPKQLQLGSRGKQTLTTQQKQNGHEFITPHQEKPPQRKILSNGSLKYPLNHEHSSKPDMKNSSKTFEETLEDMNITLLHHDTPRGMAVMKRTDQVEESSRNRKTTAVDPAPDKPEENSKRKTKAVDPAPDKPEETLKSGKIKVASSISFLISGASRESIVSELSNGELPNVSRMVRRFEDLGTMKEVEEEEEEKGNATLRENFEEFKLEDVDMGDDVSVEERPDGDGQETKNAPVSYETFLEATGLSQKSIMTPSRMYNNHRNVVRPKDVKQRSRLVKATSITNQGGNIVKYWTEPFL